MKNLDGKLDSNEINKVVTVNLRDQINKIVQSLGEACRLAQEEKDLANVSNLLKLLIAIALRLKNPSDLVSEDQIDKAL